MDSRSRQRLGAGIAASLFVAVCTVAWAQQAAPPPGQGFDPQNPGAGRFGGGQGQPRQPGQFGPPGGQGFGGPQPGFMPMAPMMPEMAKKTNQIMVLRRLLDMGLTAKDIAAALPPLKELRDAEKALQSRMEQVLDEEKRALLAADPGSQPQVDNGEKMRQVSERFHEVQNRTWEQLNRTIGPEKTQGLRELVGQGGFGPGAGFGGGFGQGGGFGGPGFGPGGGGGGFGGRGGGGGGFGPRPGGPPNGGPGIPPGGPDRELDPGSIEVEIATQTIPPSPVAPAAVPGEAGAVLPPAQVQGEGPAVAQATRPGGQGGGRGRGQFRPAPGAPGVPPGQQGPFAQGQPGQPGQPMFFGPRVTLAELVDLLEQKLAAMRR
jgi:hypothetical protein